MSIRTMNFEFPTEADSSGELKTALINGIDKYVSTGRVISEERANAIVEVVESMLVGEEPPGRRKPRAGRGGRGRGRNKLARWSKEDLESLRNLDWDTLDPIYESFSKGELTTDADLRADQKRAIMTAYKEVPGDKRAERSESANVLGRLKHLVSAYEMAEAQGWSQG